MASCIVIILMGVAHLAATNLAPQPEPKSDDEQKMHELMKTVQVDLLGTKRTTVQVMQGFGLFFTLASAAMGIAGIAIAKQAASRRVAVVYVAALAAMLISSLIYWFIIPTSFLALALVLCAISLVPRSPRPAAM